MWSIDSLARRKLPPERTQNALSGAGNGPSCDDRSGARGKPHPAQNYASWSLAGAFYDFSMTCTKTQRLSSSMDRVSLRASTPGLKPAFILPLYAALKRRSFTVQDAALMRARHAAL